MECFKSHIDFLLLFYICTGTLQMLTEFNLLGAADEAVEAAAVASRLGKSDDMSGIRPSEAKDRTPSTCCRNYYQ